LQYGCNISDELPKFKKYTSDYNLNDINRQYVCGKVSESGDDSILACRG